jgi:DNA-binding transcriptional ArsR family regulator
MACVTARDLLDEPERLRRALSPLRRQLLARLRTPASASQLAVELELPRQRLGYHLRQLEEAGLLDLVETRQRRGFTERVLRASADAYVVDPDVLAPDRPAPDPSAPGTLAPRPSQVAGDRHAAGYLADIAARTVRDVARMQAIAERQGRRLLTFTVETEVRLATPAAMHNFTEALAGAVANVVADFTAPTGRPYRVLAVGHPTPRPEGTR